MSTATGIEPPPDYPYEGWASDPHDPKYVPPERREFFASVEVTAEMYANDVRPGIGVKPYVEWAFNHRRRKTDQYFQRRLHEAERVARMPVCPICRRRIDLDLKEGRRVTQDWSTTGGGRATVVVCHRCERHAIDALSGRDVVTDDGLTRAEAASIWADDLTGRRHTNGA